MKTVVDYTVPQSVVLLDVSLLGVLRQLAKSARVSYADLIAVVVAVKQNALGLTPNKDELREMAGLDERAFERAVDTLKTGGVLVSPTPTVSALVVPGGRVPVKTHEVLPVSREYGVLAEVVDAYRRVTGSAPDQESISAVLRVMPRDAVFVVPHSVEWGVKLFLDLRPLAGFVGLVEQLSECGQDLVFCATHWRAYGFPDLKPLVAECDDLYAAYCGVRFAGHWKGEWYRLLAGLIDGMNAGRFKRIIARSTEKRRLDDLIAAALVDTAMVASAEFADRLAELNGAGDETSAQRARAMVGVEATS